MTQYQVIIFNEWSSNGHIDSEKCEIIKSHEHSRYPENYYISSTNNTFQELY